MLRFVVVALAAIGLIVFVSFVAVRLVRSRAAGMSVRMQIFLALALIVGAFAFGLGVLVLDRIKGRANLLAREAGLDEARAIAALVAGEMREHGTDLEAAARQLGAAAGEGELNLALLDPEGRAVFERGLSPSDPAAVAVSAPVELDGRSYGEVRVVKPTLLIAQTLADFAPTVLVIGLLLGAVAAASAALIGRTIATPIEQLTSFAERVSQGDRRAVRPRGAGREVKRLAHALDTMRRELEGRPFVETFAADLSHELKNPVAAIRASAEVLRDGAASEPAEAEHFVARILEATGRIEALLGDLLSLARLEARGVDDADHVRPVDLAACAAGVAARARDAGAEVAVESDGELRVRGDETWLARAIENLVDNARLHGESDKPIRIALRRVDREIVCEVRSAGTLSRHVVRRIFRRFVTTRADRGGTGLGLAIVRAVAEAHGGRAECTAPGPPEVVFAITLPAA
ncbi:MAG: HAMP domain-containing protein [Myxococcales bacterium]|nr:HAMP domain-containing protein [Myxococcales bacterium]